ncbi:protein translocase subunit SecDF [Bacillus massiliigorillae]|uniref:protein translocase subunit SecDF n=1 Tax=Bacillus massiliigorillae TaxID=1243664 RepID=UPI00039EBD22|nr:protein translocase subunit SecDF [Bacillus massiliigorillae]
MVKRSRIVAFFILVITVFSLIGTTSSGIVKDIKLGLDLQGGFEVLYQVKTEDGSKVTEDVLKNTVSALTKRIDVLGVNEPIISIEGKDRIRVQLAGVKDQNQAREILSTSAKLSFRDYNDKEMMTGKDLKEGGAKQSFDSENRPVVEVTLKDPKKFKKVTEQISSMPAPTNVLAIWLDFEEGKDSLQKPETQDNLVSAPRVSQVFNQDTVLITGGFTVKEAQNLANMLKAGALPVDLKEIYSTSVGAKFGEQALHDTIFAGVVGIAAVFLFMLFFYRFPGLIATITLSAYIYLILLIFDWMNATLTLPGIAALILGVGMAVDSNVITYERIKEEIRIGRSIKSANKNGNKTSFVTIIDANLTTLIAAGVMFYFGTSSVKGFATMLIISIIMGIFTNVFVTRLLLALCVQSGLLDKRPGWFGVKKKDIHPIHKSVDVLSLPTKFDRIDFVSKRKIFYTISSIITIIGIIFLIVFKLNLSIDFTSGTRLEITADKPLTTQQVEKELDHLKINKEDVVLSGDKNEVAVVRTQDVLDKAEILKVKDYFKDKYGHEPNISAVSPTVGKELAKNAFKSVLIASLGIILYVSIRFEWRMGLPAVIALLHDAFVIITIFSVLRLEVDLNFIAAILTIIGYSINDTIVTFDRVRENMQKKRKIKTVKELEEVVNVSTRQTMVRTVNTILTVLITVIALVIFGSESIFTFAIALLIGLVVGAYSSVFIATQLWLDFKIKELKKKGVLITHVEKKKRTDEAQV